MNEDTSLLRDATSADFEQILALNHESVHFLSPLSRERLELLHGQAVYHRVLQGDGRVAGFLLAFREGAAYDSPNYRWFAAHYARFLYIDRVVVSAAHQGQGVGKRLYADLFAVARQSDAEVVTCEIDIDPPNGPSHIFHQRYGFREVGSQLAVGGKKRVSLQAVAL